MAAAIHTSDSPFPSEFVWGAATSAYQIEGAFADDGKGLSIWDTFCRQEGAIAGGDTGESACEHYHRFRDDVGLMRQIGLQAYRLSISWPRVIPNGAGNVNEVGLAFYDALVDELLAAQIQPWVTLFHWDYPQTLYDKGGWLAPESVEWFADYSRVVVERLSDRVQHWITLNEPQVFLQYGHRDGIHAPGLNLSLAEQLTATHHALLAHGRAVQVIREVAKKKPTIGWAPVGVVKTPATATPRNIKAAAVATMGISGESTWNNTWYSDPVLLGCYPEDGLASYGKAVPKHSSAELELISTPIDFLGLNIYTGDPVQAAEDGGWVEMPVPQGVPRTTMDWPVVAESLYWGPKFHSDRYHVPIAITENGMANVDWVAMDGTVQDPQRIDYVRRHLLALRAAMDDGIDIAGYFLWSLLDNFEWAEGYRRRFGLIHVDFESQQRVLKDSAYWYRKVIETNGRSLLETPGK